MRKTISLAIVLAAAGWALAEDSKSEPRPIPLTRPEMKQLLEDMKQRKPRIPLPELTEEEKAKLGERGGGYESRLRALYMPGGDSQGRPGGGGGGGGGGGANESGMSLDNKFKVQLFWIVSRANNCQYCLGHQESKLLNAGMKEDEIAALDGDWSEFNAAERTAFAFGRKFTYEPHNLNDADIDGLRKHFKDLQILEMILSMAGNNSINRWKEGAGVPQSQGGGGFGQRPGTGTTPPPERPTAQTYLTPTSDAFKNKITKVAVVQMDEKSGQPTKKCLSIRPPLEARADVEKALEVARKRTPRLPLADEAKAREVAPEELQKGPLPQWALLLANFPTSAKNRISSILNADTKGDLKPLLKAQVSWIIARQDRAWYATGQAKQRLKDLGQTDDQIYKLDGDWKDFTPAERALFTVARKLASSPVVLTDEDVAEALKQTGPREVVQMISYTTNRASFDRITEAAGLQVEK